MNGPLAVGMTLVVTLVFLGLGRVSAALRRDPGSLAFDVAAGWGLASAAMAAAALLHLALMPIAGLIGVVGVGGLLLPRRHQPITVLALILLITLPLLIIAAATPALIYDEFGHWLPNGRFLFEFGIFPSLAHPNLWSDMPAYPYGGPLINYFASLIAGQWLDAPSKLFTILLFGAFGWTCVEELDASSRGWPRAAMLAVAIGILVFFDPGFDPRTALTAYTDAPSGVLAGLEALAGWHAIEAFAARDDLLARRWSARAGLVGLALVYTRDTNLVFLAGVGLGLLLCGGAMAWREPMRAAAAVAALVAIPAAGLMLWRLYRVAAELPRPLGIFPFSAWRWDAPGIAFKSLLTARLADHPLLGGLALVFAALLLVAAVSVFRRAGASDRRLGIIVCATALTWYVFVGWAYIATIPPEEFDTAVGLWRYISMPGPLLMFIFIPALRHAAAPSRPLAAGALIALVFAVPIAYPARWRLDCTFSDVVAARRIAPAFAAELKDAPQIFVVAVDEADWLAVAVDYELSLPRARLHAVYLPQGAALPTFTVGSVILDLRPLDRDAIRADGRVPSVTLYRAGNDNVLTQVAETAPSSFDQTCGFPLRRWLSGD
jgi:hypothetical protein